MGLCISIYQAMSACVSAFMAFFRPLKLRNFQRQTLSGKHFEGLAHKLVF